MSQNIYVDRTLQFNGGGGGTAKLIVDTDDSATITYIRPATDDTGAVYFGDGTKDMDVRFTLGSAAVYAEFNVGNAQLNLVGVDLATNNVIAVTDAALNATTGRLGKFIGTISAGNIGDGYGAVEVDLTLAGTTAGNVAALSSWLEMTAGTSSSGYICAQTNGIYEEDITMSGGVLVFGMKMSAIMTDTTGWTALTPFALNTTQAVTAMFYCENLANNLGLTVGEHSSAVYGSIPLTVDTNGNKLYIRVHATAS